MDKEMIRRLKSPSRPPSASRLRRNSSAPKLEMKGLESLKTPLIKKHLTSSSLGITRAESRPSSRTGPKRDLGSAGSSSSRRKVKRRWKNLSKRVMSKAGKKKDSTNRINSGAPKNDPTLAALAAQQQAASLVGSVASVDSRGRVKSYPVWPEFNENDVNAEKWDSTGKGKEKGKSPNMQVFDDPEGKIDLPSSLNVHEWKRPQEFLQGLDPVIMLDEKQTELDLLHPNEHLCHSELMRYIISQITSLWNISVKAKNSASSARNPSTPDITDESEWRPWHHIYSQNKVGKGPPMYNAYGKYVVRLYWMGCWRKIVVDDQIPFDDQGRILLPVTASKNELWSLLLSKALIKIASIDYNNGNQGCEFGDYFVLHSLTGWLPETIPLQYGHLQKVWELLKDILPTWERPEKEVKPKESETIPPVVSTAKKDRLESSSGGKVDTGSAQKGAKGKDKKKEDREKSKSSPHSARPTSAKSNADIKSAVTEEVVAEKIPEMVVFATFSHPSESPARVHVLKEMADSSEKLRKVGLSHLHPLPIQLTQVRDIPLIRPVTPPVTPRWKLVRPRRKRITPSDEPIPEPEPPKPDQWLEIMSEYINHKISPLPLDPNHIKSRSSPRGLKSSRPSTAATQMKEIDEDDESGAKDDQREDGVYRAQQVSSQSQRSQKPRTTSTVPSHDEARGPSVEAESTKGSGETTLQEQDKSDKADKSDEKESQSSHSLESISKKVWIDFEDFCKCFQTLVIFHKPGTYTCTHSTSEIKYSVINGTSSGGTASKKGSANANQSSSGTNVKSSSSQHGVKAYESFPVEERQPVFLFVDNVKPTELIVALSVLSRWPGMESERKMISDKDSVAGASEIMSAKDQKDPVPQGLLVAEQYTWKTLVTGQPILRIRTTGVRAACLTLPAGRHVLKIIFNTPLGYNLTVSSSVDFQIGDEESIMKYLENESCRFIETAKNIINGVGKCIESIGNKEAWLAARKELHRAHMPYKPTKEHTTARHYKNWHEAFYHMMCDILSDDRDKPLMRALRLFTMDCSPMETIHPILQRDENEVHEAWVDRQPTDKEIEAVTKLQKNLRGKIVRNLRRYLIEPEKQISPQSQYSSKDILLKAWENIQTNLTENGLKLLRLLLKNDPQLVSKYSFYKDEWNKICYEDYSGTYVEQVPNTWFIVFREVFYANADILCLPKLYIPIKTCVLRVIDNDTNTEVNRIFHKVAPFVYKKNKRGYTFVCEAFPNQFLPAGKWQMRLIGEQAPLPAPVSGQVNTQFLVKEIKDYYIPNDKHILLRYHVKTSANHIASLQLKTSKPEAYVTLQILDNEQVVVSTRGKGHCVIPAFCFLTNEKSERPGSRSSNQESRHMLTQPSKPAIGNSGKKRTGSAKSKDGKSSPKQPRKPSTDTSKSQIQPEFEEDDGIIHKYTIQAIVEHKSWPLSESQWTFVQKLKEIESDEIKAYTANKDRPGSPNASRMAASGGKATGAGDKGKKGGKGDKKDKKSHDKETGSRPPSQSVFDDTKAYWLLRFVSDSDYADKVEVNKDVDRQEEIRALKLAWEAAEPGRAIKAMQSRLAFLNKRGVNKENVKDSEKENEEELPKEDQEDEMKPEVFSHMPPPYLLPKPVFEEMDLNAFYRPNPSEVSQVHYLNEERKILQEKQMEKEVAKYKELREEIIAGREKEKIERMQLKQDQFRAYQDMQYALDEARFELLKPREAYRQSLLEEERRKKEEEEARLAALETEDRSGSASPKGKKSGKKSAGKKK